MPTTDGDEGDRSVAPKELDSVQQNSSKEPPPERGTEWGGQVPGPRGKHGGGTPTLRTVCAGRGLGTSCHPRVRNLSFMTSGYGQSAGC